MPLFVAALIGAALASGAWCAAVVVSGRVRGRSRSTARAVLGVVLLTAIVGAGVALRFLLLPPHHAMYLDEPWYAEAACNMARSGQLVLCEDTWSGRACIDYGKAPGWPILLSAWTLVVGCDTMGGIHLTRALGSATILLVALAALCAGARWWQSLVAAALAALYPVHVEWSATGETNVAAAALFLVGLCGALVYLRRGRLCGAVLATTGFGVATAVRPESCVAAVTAAIVLMLVARTPPLQRVLVGCAIVLICALSAAASLPLWAMNESISGGAFLSVGNLAANGRALVRPESLRVQGVVVALGLAGAVGLARAQRDGAAWLLLASALAAALVVLAYDRFHPRMLLAAMIGVLPLTGCAFAAVGTAADRRARAAPVLAVACLLAVGLLWRGDLLAASIPSETQLLETRIAARMSELSPDADALFIASQPTVLNAAGLPAAMATQRALQGEAQLRQAIDAGRPVYFLCDMFCEPGFEGGASAALCGEMFARFPLAPVIEERLHGRTYILYRVTGHGPGSVPAECPRRADHGSIGSRRPAPR